MVGAWRLGAIAAAIAVIAVESATAAPRRDVSMVLPVVDRPEMRSYQPYSGLQFGFRPNPPVQRGVRSSRPEIIMPMPMAPLIGAPGADGVQWNAYCADRIDGTIEPRTGPYDPHPVERRCR